MAAKWKFETRLVCTHDNIEGVDASFPATPAGLTSFIEHYRRYHHCLLTQGEIDQITNEFS